MSAVEGQDILFFRTEQSASDCRGPCEHPPPGRSRTYSPWDGAKSLIGAAPGPSVSFHTLFLKGANTSRENGLEWYLKNGLKRSGPQTTPAEGPTKAGEGRNRATAQTHLSLALSKGAICRLEPKGGQADLRF